MNNDKHLLTQKIISPQQLIEHIRENGVKEYHFVIPEDKLSEKFVKYAESFSSKNFGKNIFDIEIMDSNEYLHLSKPKAFRKYINEKK